MAKDPDRIPNIARGAAAAILENMRSGLRRPGNVVKFTGELQMAILEATHGEEWLVDVKLRPTNAVVELRRWDGTVGDLQKPPEVYEIEIREKIH